ncbi:MAG TPA: alpha/beta hydrolase [Chlorobaculum sp.]|uniref:Dihydrolipoamide acetyltransferase, putative n=1 Tax=Chlorobaculum tepidum (strain ATCC 49652 / DSM 12025 / NBRC 103806 / TLS) TaxID=194439 RepID=Q8KF08_CHLTE|nr:alpha/beta hydrolase [Chlorobaculum tepidum]AAM71766.1 dihydrolipoamide acetyltransferase, putative [Chlorobaculum tepidum TLS]HBU24004.1 alpha/beta hydrolase [Chlorobaculum sp.]
MKTQSQDRWFIWQLSEELEAKIRYREYGPPDSPFTPLLFIHGYGGMIEHWNDNIPSFDDRYRIYAMDLIGFGQSGKPNVRYSLALFAAQIKAFMHLKKLEKVTLVGHSMGAASSIIYAHHNPDSVRALVLANPSGLYGDSMDGVAKIFFGLVGSPLIGEMLFAAFANPVGVSQSLTPTYYNQKKVDLNLINQFSRPLQDRGAIFSYLSPSKRPHDFMLDGLKPCNYKGDAWLLWGAEDTALPPHKIIPEFQELLPQAGAYIIPKAGHCIHHDAHETFNNRLAQLLQRLE